MNVPTIGANFEITGYDSVQCTGDPMKDAKNFADANGISVEEAKKVLSGQFGDPKVQETKNTTTTTNIETEDDEVELDDEVEDFTDDEITNVEENDDDGIAQEDIDSINNAIDGLDEKNTEYKNCYNNWAATKGKYGLSELITSIKNYQTDAYALIEAIDAADLSDLDYSVRKDIDNTKDKLKTWLDRYTTAKKAWGGAGWHQSGDAWKHLWAAINNMKKHASELVSKLQTAGL